MTNDTAERCVTRFDGSVCLEKTWVLTKESEALNMGKKNNEKDIQPNKWRQWRIRKIQNSAAV
jgi:hypothetical protein